MCCFYSCFLSNKTGVFVSLCSLLLFVKCLFFFHLHFRLFLFWCIFLLLLFPLFSSSFMDFSLFSSNSLTLTIHHSRLRFFLSISLEIFKNKSRNFVWYNFSVRRWLIYIFCFLFGKLAMFIFFFFSFILFLNDGFSLLVLNFKHFELCFLSAYSTEITFILNVKVNTEKHVQGKRKTFKTRANFLIKI